MGGAMEINAPYNPQANDQDEAGVKIVTNKLRLTLEDFVQRCPGMNPRKLRRQWPAILPYVTYARNRCLIGALEFSPYEMLFGRSPRLPSTVPSDEDQINSLARAEAAQYLKQLQIALTNVHKLIKDKTVKRRKRMTDVYNNKRSPLIWKEGDHVYIAHPYSQKPKKLKPRTRGPYKVKEVTLHPKTNDVVSVSVDITPPG